VPERKSDLVNEMLSTIKKFSSPVVKSTYIKKLAEATNVEEADLLAAMKGIKDYSFKETPVEAKSFHCSDIPAVERTILKLVLDQEHLIKSLLLKINSDYFQDPRIKKIFELIFNLSHEGKSLAPNQLLSRLDDESLCRIVSEVCSSNAEPDPEGQNLFDDCISRLIKERQKTQLKLLQNQIKEAQSDKNESELNRLIKDYNDLIKITKGCG
jgi:DNA primase